MTEQTNGLVPLHRELDAITSYLKLEKIRFEDEIIASPHCGQDLAPEFLLQPLVENALKYGMKTSSLPLRPAIRCTMTDQRLTVEVANTGKGLGETEPGLKKSGIDLAAPGLTYWATIVPAVYYFCDGFRQLRYSRL